MVPFHVDWLKMAGENIAKLVNYTRFCHLLNVELFQK